MENILEVSSEQGSVNTSRISSNNSSANNKYTSNLKDEIQNFEDFNLEDFHIFVKKCWYFYKENFLLTNHSDIYREYYNIKKNYLTDLFDEKNHQCFTQIIFMNVLDVNTGILMNEYILKFINDVEKDVEVR